MLKNISLNKNWASTLLVIGFFLLLAMAASFSVFFQTPSQSKNNLVQFRLLFKDLKLSHSQLFEIKNKDEEIHLKKIENNWQLISSHSHQILEGRVPINPNLLEIIEHHHSFSTLRPVAEENREEIITGIETVLISMVDIISAMISQRPYREPVKIFEALKLVQHLMAKDYPSEYKMLIQFFRYFFK